MGHSTRKKLGKNQKQINNFVTIYNFTYEALESLISVVTPKAEVNKKYYPVYRKR